jgi:hypothetical protein
MVQKEVFLGKFNKGKCPFKILLNWVWVRKLDNS